MAIHALRNATLVANPARKARKTKSKSKSKRKTSARKTSTKAKGRKVKAKRIMRIYRTAGKTKTGKRRRSPFRVVRNGAAEDYMSGTPKAPRKARKSRSKSRRTSSGSGRRKTKAFLSIYRGRSYKTKSGKRRAGGLFAVRNPGLVFAGIPVIPATLGAATAIAFGTIGERLASKYGLADKLGPLSENAGDVAILAAAWAVNKWVKHPMAKDAARYAGIVAIFRIVNKLAEHTINGLVDKIPGLGGAYLPVQTAGNVNGAYFDPYAVQQALPAGVGGFADDVNGLNLFQGQSIYG